MSYRLSVSEDLTDDEWLAEMEALGEAEGYFQPLGPDHAAVFVDDSLDTLFVSFDTIGAARASNPAGLPYPLLLAAERGWSHLSLYSRKATWFRHEAVYRYFDRLIDEGFLEDFERVIFFGAGSGGYAAAAFSVAAPGATVIALAPQATLDPAMAEWDDRFIGARHLNFTDRYGYAPDMLDAADRAFVVYDPMVELDAMHAALFRRPNVSRIRFRHAGTGLPREMMAMGALRKIFDKAGAGTLTAHDFYRALRERHNYLPYLRNLLNHVHVEERDFLTAVLCRAALDRKNAPRFRHHLEIAEHRLAEAGRRLPPRHRDRPREAAKA